MSRTGEELSKEVSQLDWGFRTADTRYLTHGVHRYSGKFIPQVARTAVELISDPGDVVLDPYCGSGTTLLECALANRKCIGVDINPLAVLISRVKTTPIPGTRVHDFTHRLLGELGSVLGEQTLFSLADGNRDQRLAAAQNDPRISDPWYQKWYPRDVLLGLVAIDHVVREIDDEALRDLALVAFSDILRKCSLAHSGYPNVMFDRKRRSVADPYESFATRLAEIVETVIHWRTPCPVFLNLK